MLPEMPLQRPHGHLANFGQLRDTKIASERQRFPRMVLVLKGCIHARSRFRVQDLKLHFLFSLINVENPEILHLP